MTAATERHVRMASQLYEARDAARSLLGEKYQNRMQELGAAIKHVAAQRAISDLSAATMLAQQTSGFGVVMVLAAVVELTEPTP